MAGSDSLWGTVGWWTIVVISIPFSLYAAVFIYGDFDIYKQLTIKFNAGNLDIAGLNILHHLRAWQIHAAAAEAFIFTGPFQFSASFRKKFPTTHRQLGYVFVFAGVACSITGLLVLIPNSDFGTSGRAVFFLQGLFLLYFLFVAVRTARQRKFQVHQKYMIRAAATGYAVIAMRLLPAIFQLMGMSFLVALEVGAICATMLFVGTAELYIQTVLRKKLKSN